MRNVGQDRTLMNLACKRIQVDEAWSLCYAKQKNVPTAKAAPEGAGDIWTWVGLDAQSKLAVSWYVGGRDSEAPMAFMDDLAKRLANRVQLTSDTRLIWKPSRARLVRILIMPCWSKFTVPRQKASDAIVQRNASARPSIA
jgi:hypothetical protein